MRAFQGAVGTVLIVVGLVVFLCSVDRSAWVLVGMVLVALGAVIIVDLYEVGTPTLTDVCDQIMRGLRGTR